MHRFKELRLETGLSQSEYGRLFNLSQQAVSGYENGTRFPEINIVEKLANYHDCSVDYILGKTNLRKWESETLAFNTASLDGLSDEDIAAVKQIIEGLKAKHLVQKK